MRVLPLAYDPMTFLHDAKIREKGRAELGYGSSEVVVMSAGKFQAKKRLDLLVEAWSRLARYDDRLRLLFVGIGDNGQLAELQARLRSCGICTSRLQVVGFVNAQKLNEAFNLADVGVWPRMPAVTIQQAMGTGLAVVIPRNELVGHLLRPGSGKYFDVTSAEDTDSMIDALQEVLSGLDPQDTSTRAKRASINSRLSADEVANSILKDVGLTDIEQMAN